MNFEATFEKQWRKYEVVRKCKTNFWETAKFGEIAHKSNETLKKIYENSEHGFRKVGTERVFRNVNYEKVFETF